MQLPPPHPVPPLLLPPLPLIRIAPLLPRCRPHPRHPPPPSQGPVCCMGWRSGMSTGVRCVLACRRDGGAASLGGDTASTARGVISGGMRHAVTHLRVSSGRGMVLRCSGEAARLVRRGGAVLVASQDLGGAYQCGWVCSGAADSPACSAARRDIEGVAECRMSG